MRVNQSSFIEAVAGDEVKHAARVDAQRVELLLRVDDVALVAFAAPHLVRALLVAGAGRQDHDTAQATAADSDSCGGGASVAMLHSDMAGSPGSGMQHILCFQPAVGSSIGNF